ncbi:hypothetical protein BGZ80_007704 [Entomortierella chlamydospora]|uniref:WD40 repeat-like protein n=1 Tax=Entomortierella chlamydospora TaxID=101097 RepID=A0A9P6T4Y4_9FUNG|nr:hypothetical protein BGZ80_007704 [Entomortierella chlamydospora]
MKRVVKKPNAGNSDAEEILRDGFARAYLMHSKLLADLGYSAQAQISHKRAEKWGGLSIKIEAYFPPSTPWNLPALDERLTDTPQLVSCLSLLRALPLPDDALEPSVRKWVQEIENNSDEIERLERLGCNLILYFSREEFKDEKTVAEVLCLAPVLNNNDFRHLLSHFFKCIDQSSLLDFSSLTGLAQLIQSASPGYLTSDDLVKVLGRISTHLQETHEQSPNYIFQLAVALSHVLDAMADTEVTGLDRINLHEPLSAFLNDLQKSSDPHLVYQAAYAYQALQWVPDDETPWQATVRRATKVMKGISGLVSAANGLDLHGLLRSLVNIQEGLDFAVETFKAVQNAYVRANILSTSGQSFVECLKQGLSFERKCAWYLALRGADTLIQGGELAKFRVLVCEATCRYDPAFQWGICERLGKLAADSQWDTKSRQSAVLFLGEIYKHDAVWGQHVQIKQYILDILLQLSSSSRSHLQVAATLLQDLKKDGDATKQELYRNCVKEGPSRYALKACLPELANPSLLDRVQNKPDVEADLRRLARDRSKKRGSPVYIPPQAKASIQASDNSLFDLTEKVNEFLDSPRKVLLLLGDSGVGKSTFNRELEHNLWKAYKKKDGRIPLFISLPEIDRPEKELIVKKLRKLEFSESQIRVLKDSREFILICDGYDETQQTHNLYDSNHLNDEGEWKAQMIISCRTEYVGLDYRYRFQPGDRNQSSELALFQEAVISPFSNAQIKDYIKTYVDLKAPLWEAKDYQEVFDRIPSLQELVKNPFLLSLSLEVLPRVIDPEKILSSTKFTRVTLYDEFVAQWLERNKKRLSENAMSRQEKKAFESLSDEGFTLNGMTYLKELSIAIYEKQGGNPVVEYLKTRDEGTWKDRFFGREDEKQILRDACPLSRSGSQFRFVHRSILEYGMSRAIYEPQERAIVELEPKAEVKRRGSVSSVYSFELEGAIEEVPVNIVQGPDLNSPLAKRNFVRETSILQFLEDRVQQEPAFRDQLIAYIENSKTDKRWRLAAANAATILVRAGVHFIGTDLKDIKIPGADLSHGVFDSAQLQGADLRKVQLRSTWLRKADLSTARMDGVRFGELPLLQEDSQVYVCIYSPDGETFAIGLEDGTISLYDTSKWKKIHTLKGHAKTVDSIVFSPTCEQIASCGFDPTVRLWDVKTGQLLHALGGPTGGTESLLFYPTSNRGDFDVEKFGSVVYSPTGKQIASGGWDKAIRLWDTQTGQLCHTFSGHDNRVTSMAYSPTGERIVSGSKDGTVRLWDANTGQLIYTLDRHTNEVLCVAYSFNGTQIASGSLDRTVNLWDAQSGQHLHTLGGHARDVSGVMYSPSGEQIASRSKDRKLRLWNAYTGQLLHTLEGHTNNITSMTYSPTGTQIASSSWDKSVRLWDTQTGHLQNTFDGHTYCVVSVAYSRDGDQIASGGLDKKVRLWDAQAGQSHHTFDGHTDAVLELAYSLTSDQVASRGVDKTVRLWNVRTGQLCHTLGHANNTTSMAYSPSGEQIVCGDWDKTVKVWDARTGHNIHTFEGHDQVVVSVAFSPIGEQIVSGSWDETVRLWDAETGKLHHTLSGHTDRIMCVAYSPNGKQIASGGWDNTVRLWDAQTGAPGFIFDGHTDCVEYIVFSPSGREIASRGLDKTVRLWDTQTGQLCHTLCAYPEDDSDVLVIMYSPSGDQIAIGTRTGVVRLWNTQTGQLQTILDDGHTDGIECMEYLPTGEWIASGSMDGTLRLWDVASGQCLVIMSGFCGSVTGVKWRVSSDGCFLATSCHDKSVRLWKVTEEGKQMEMIWNSAQSTFNVSNTSIQDVQGLSEVNKELLRQRGAVGKPSPCFPTASEKADNVAFTVNTFSMPNMPLPRDTKEIEAMTMTEAQTPATPAPGQMQTICEQRASYV